MAENGWGRVQSTCACKALVAKHCSTSFPSPMNIQIRQGEWALLGYILDSLSFFLDLMCFSYPKMHQTLGEFVYAFSPTGNNPTVPTMVPLHAKLFLNPLFLPKCHPQRGWPCWTSLSSFHSLFLALALPVEFLQNILTYNPINCLLILCSSWLAAPWGQSHMHLILSLGLWPADLTRVHTVGAL